MQNPDARTRIEQEEDFINSNKYSFSLKKFLETNPDGIEDSAYIGRMLCMTEEEVEETLKSAIKKIREMLGEE